MTISLQVWIPRKAETGWFTGGLNDKTEWNARIAEMAERRPPGTSIKHVLERAASFKLRPPLKWGSVPLPPARLDVIEDLDAASVRDQGDGIVTGQLQQLGIRRVLPSIAL